MNLLFFPTDFSYAAVTTEWRIQREIPDGMSFKFKTRNCLSEQTGIVKARFEQILFAEFCWSRLARMAGLPAVPVQWLTFSRQFISRHKYTIGLPFGILIWWIPSKEASRIWKLPSKQLRAEGLDVKLVSELKAFALWSHAGGGEVGEFMVSNDGIPFLVDQQDAFYMISKGEVVISPWMIRNYLVDEEQYQYAREFWTTLPGLVNAEGWPALFEKANEYILADWAFLNNPTPLGEQIKKLLLFRSGA
jgi:hypothetical protein